MRVVLLALLGGSLVLTAGCSLLYEEHRVPPEYDVRGQQVLVIPFREGKFWYGESQAGSKLASTIDYELQEKCSVTIAPQPAKMLQRLATTFDESELPWEEFGKEVGADLVVYGTIRKLDVNTSKVVGMLQGTLLATYEVWDVEKNTRVYAGGINRTYPRDAMEGGPAVFDSTPEGITAKLFSEGGKQVTDALCGFEKDTMER